MASLVVNGWTAIILLEIKVVLFDYVQHKYFSQLCATSNLFLTWVVVKQPSPLQCANPKLIKMNGEWKGILILKLLWMARNRSLLLNDFLWLSVENELISLVKSYGTNGTASNFLQSMGKHVWSHMWDFEGVLEGFFEHFCFPSQYFIGRWRVFCGEKQNSLWLPVSVRLGEFHFLVLSTIGRNVCFFCVCIGKQWVFQ